MAYVKQFTKPYADGYKNNDETTQVTAEIKNMETNTFLALENFASETDGKFDNLPTKLSDLEDDSLHRTVTDTEKNTWNNKASVFDIPSKISELEDDPAHRTVTETEKTYWNDKADPADIPDFDNKEVLDDLSANGDTLLFKGNPIGGGGASSWNELTGKPFNSLDNTTIESVDGVLSVKDVYAEWGTVYNKPFNSVDNDTLLVENEVLKVKPVETGWEDVKNKPFNTLDPNTLENNNGVLTVIGGSGGSDALSKYSSGNPLKLESADAPIIDFKVNGFTEQTKVDEENHVVDSRQVKLVVEGNTLKRQADTYNNAIIALVESGKRYKVTTFTDGYIGFYTSSASFDADTTQYSTIKEGENIISIPSGVVMIIFDGGDFYNSLFATVYEMPKYISLGQTYGCVDLGSLNWQKSGNGYYDAYVPNAKDNTTNAFIEGYELDSTSNIYVCKNDMTFAFYLSNIWLVNKSCATSQELVSSLQGKKIYYEPSDESTADVYIRVDESNNLFDDMLENGGISSSGVKEATTKFVRNINPILINSNKVTIKFEQTMGFCGAYFYNGNNFISRVETPSSKDTFEYDVPSNANTLYFVATKTIGQNIDVNSVGKVTVTSNSQTVFIPTLNPLQDGDYIQYHVDGTGTEHRKYGIVDLGSLNWYYATYFRAPLPLSAEVARIETPKWICTNYDVVSIQTLTTTTENALSKNNSDNNILVRDSAYTDATSFKSAMQGVMLIYELAEPTDTPLTDNQIAELKKLKTYKSETNISTEELGSMDIQYYCDNSNAEVVADIQRQVNDIDASGSDMMPNYANLIGTVAVKSDWTSSTTAIEYTAEEDCWIAGGISTYFNSGSAPTPALDVMLRILIENNIVGLSYLSKSDSSATTPINYYLRKGQKFKVVGSNTNTKYKAWIYAYGTGNDSARSAQPMLLSDDEATQEE